MNICDLAFWLKLASVVASIGALFFTARQMLRGTLWRLTVVATIQSLLVFTPQCASVLDLRNWPIVGQPARSR
jgi:hypothetical protein